MLGILGKAAGIKPRYWIIGGLAAAALFFYWQHQDEVEDRIRYMIQGEQLEQQLREAEATLQEERAERQRVERLAAERAQRLEAIRTERRELSRELRELEERNDAVAAWAGERVPDAVIDRLRRRPEGDNPDGD